MHQWFEEAERIWKEEFTNLADRLNEQQQILPYTMAYKLFTSQTFQDFINSCTKAQIDGTVTEALEMVKEDYPKINVEQSTYGYQLGANDRADKDLAWTILNPPRFPVLDYLLNHNKLITPWELLDSTVDADENYSRLRAEEG